ncbi:DPP IV N-terminal domain-containing protein [Candidatus Neomarinimicrobiota bacterium]
MRRSAAISYPITLILLIATQGLAQDRLSRSEIYDQWDELNLTQKSGDGRVTWLPEGMGYLESEVDPVTDNQLFYKVNPIDQKRTLLFDKKTETSMIQEYNRLTGKSETGFPFNDFDYLPDHSGIRFRVQDAGEFVYWFMAREMLKLVEPRSELAGWEPHRSSRQLYTGSYSPDYSKIAYVKGYDIYVLDSKNGREEQITFGGTEEIMNGRTDWVYPEETDQSEAFWWSPDGKQIAYLQFDVRAEHEYPIIHEIDLEQDEGFDHYRFKTHLEIERYPKAGESNPTVKLFIVDVASKKTVEVKTESSPDVYIIRIEWFNSGKELIFQRLNRFQNRLELLAANPRNGAARTILVEEEECFVQLHNNFRQLNDGKHFLWSSERTGWNHLYRYDLRGKLVSQLTDGDWEVSRIQCIDEKSKLVYFSANTNAGLESQFFRVSFDGKDFKQLTTAEGVHNINIDPAGKFFTDNYSSLTTPPVVNLHSSDGKLISQLSETTLDSERMGELGLELPELVIFKAADGQTDLHALLYKPAQYDPNQQYPLIVSVYGGPTGGVRNSFSIGNRMAQLGYFVIKQDNRGTTNRGKEYLTDTYLKFGQVEIDDQAAGVRLISQRPYIDGSRVGIYGGSYGGYSTCMSLLRYPDLFHVGVARSSVTDWRSYDTIYTERYMRTPQVNPEGYRLGSAMTYVDNLKGKLLLIHGLIDNNVHIGNTIHLADALQRAGKEFDLMVYPENRHSIRGYHSDHLDKLMTAYFLKHLNPEDWEERLKAVWQ